MSGPYAFEFKPHGTFTPDGRAPELVTSEAIETHNAAIEAQELAHWATGPERFAAYVTDKGVTTWRGVVLARVMTRNTYRNNIGARMTGLRVRGTNGFDYHGRYGSDWTQLIRLRRCI